MRKRTSDGKAERPVKSAKSAPWVKRILDAAASHGYIIPKRLEFNSIANTKPLPILDSKRLSSTDYFPNLFRGLKKSTVRSFDLDQDEHPVKYVTTKLSDGLYTSIYEWFSQEIADGTTAMPDPSSVAIPDF